MLSRFLRELFPSLTNLPPDSKCWVAKAIESDRPELVVFSRALQAVDECGELSAFSAKLIPEHPVNVEHNIQYDERVRDCLNEACAFAWAYSTGLGTPKFSGGEGTPDIWLSGGNWVEAKSIHRSDDDIVRMERMLAGEVDYGTIAKPSQGLYRKFSSSLDDAVEKFRRQGQVEETYPNVIFFNLSSLDTPQEPIKDKVLAGLSKWAAETEESLAADESLSEIRLVMCYQYAWHKPIRDPFRPENK